MSSNWLKAMATSSPRWGYIFLTKTKEGQMLYYEEWKVLGASPMCSKRRKSILRCGKLSVVDSEGGIVKHKLIKSAIC
jgi:hypothetical protein